MMTMSVHVNVITIKFMEWRILYLWKALDKALKKLDKWKKNANLKIFLQQTTSVLTKTAKFNIQLY